MRYDSRLRPLEFAAGKIRIPESAAGKQTDIGTTPNEALGAAQGKQLAGVLLLGDGADGVRAASRNAAGGPQMRDDFAAPLYTVTFGLAGDAAQARDVAIDRFDEQFTVFVKNELLVARHSSHSRLREPGFARRSDPDRRQRKIEDDWAPHDPANEDNRQVEVEFTYTPQEPGHYGLALEALAAAGRASRQEQYGGR